MVIALIVWEGRIAPLFDVARRARMVEVAGGQIARQWDEALPDGDVAAKIERLSALGAERVVCGAISRMAQDGLAARGIRGQGFVAGDADDVLRSLIAGGPMETRFAMPGCCGGQGTGGGWGAGGGRRGGRGGRGRCQQGGGAQSPWGQAGQGPWILEASSNEDKLQKGGS